MLKESDLFAHLYQIAFNVINLNPNWAPEFYKYGNLLENLIFFWHKAYFVRSLLEEFLLGHSEEYHGKRFLTAMGISVPNLEISAEHHS